jgi:hypothetical protein
MTETEKARRVDRKSIQALIEILTTAESLEEQAMSHFLTLTNKHPDLKRSTVPRWGSHSPR